MIDWVLAAYEHDPGALPPALVVFGPFMTPDQQAGFSARAATLPKVRAITFDVRPRTWMARAAGVVAMGGYNTFCEILSFDKPALIVPRTTPRLEQAIRARRAAELGLVSVLEDDYERDPGIMAAAVDAIAAAEAAVLGGDSRLLDGMASVNRLTRQWLDYDRSQRFSRGARLNA